MILHGYWRSGPSCRTRIGLDLNGVAYRQAPVHLLAGDLRDGASRAPDPHALVPAQEAAGAAVTRWRARRIAGESATPEPMIGGSGPA